MKECNRKMKTLQKINVSVMLILLLILMAFLVWFYVRWVGPSNAEIKSAIETESDSLRVHVAECSARTLSKVDRRADEIERRLDQLDAKLDSIDAKLDKLMRLVSPPLPDGLKRADDPAL